MYAKKLVLMMSLFGGSMFDLGKSHHVGPGFTF